MNMLDGTLFVLQSHQCIATKMSDRYKTSTFSIGGKQPETRCSLFPITARLGWHIEGDNSRFPNHFFAPFSQAFYIVQMHQLVDGLKPNNLKRNFTPVENANR